MISWYVVKLAPGTTRQAPQRIFIDPSRKEESIAERAIRDAGLIAYCPSMRKDVIHHRTKKTITKRYPLMTGYLFAGFEAAHPNFMILGSLREVSSILGVNGKPFQVRHADVQRFMDEEADMQFDDTKAARIHRREIGRTERATLEMTYAAGTAIIVNDGPFAGHHGAVKSITGRKTVKAIMNLLGGLVEIEVPVESLERVA